MAIYSPAQDINTREVIWVSQNVVKGRPQINSHNSDCYARDGIDGFNSAELAGLHTDYVGNGWQDKYSEFVEKWGEPE
jgi:hypothetical protein